MKKIIAALLFVCALMQSCTSAGAYDCDVINHRESYLAAADTLSFEFETTAKAVVLMEKSTKTVLYSQNEHERLYPASVTKIMTMLLICEAIEAGSLNLEEKIVCSETAAAKGGSQIWLEAGELMSADDLLKALCIYSANDACALLGERIAGSEEAFVAMMNARAQQLGLENTHFDNCTGLDDTTDSHLTSAYDIAVIASELLCHDIIKNYTTVWMDTLRNGETQLVNTNKLVRSYKGITGLKTGTTQKAGYCVCASARRADMELIAVVLGSESSEDRFSCAAALLDGGFASYALVTPKIETVLPDKLAVQKGEFDLIDYVLPELEPVLVGKSQEGEVKAQITLNHSLTAPVEKGEGVGSIQVSCAGEVIKAYPVTAAARCERLTFFTAIYRLLTSF